MVILATMPIGYAVVLAMGLVIIVGVGFVTKPRKVREHMDTMSGVRHWTYRD